jgi:hypothetical protein
MWLKLIPFTRKPVAAGIHRAGDGLAKMLFSMCILILVKAWAPADPHE